MEDHVRALQNGRNLFVVADVRALEIHRRTHFLQVLFAAREEVIEHHHAARALPQKAAHDRGADEAGASGDNVFVHWDSRYRSDSRAMVFAPGVKSKTSAEIQPG